LGPVIGLDLAQERALLRARRRTWEPWHHVISERLPHLTGLAALLGDREWATTKPASDGFWHVWTTLDAIDRMVADPDRADGRRASPSISQTLARQRVRLPSLPLARYSALTHGPAFVAHPMLPAH